MVPNKRDKNEARRTVNTCLCAVLEKSRSWAHQTWSLTSSLSMRQGWGVSVYIYRASRARALWQGLSASEWSNQITNSPNRKETSPSPATGHWAQPFSESLSRPNAEFPSSIRNFLLLLFLSVTKIQLHITNKQGCVATGLCSPFSVLSSSDGSRSPTAWDLRTDHHALSDLPSFLPGFLLSLWGCSFYPISFLSFWVPPWVSLTAPLAWLSPCSSASLFPSNTKHPFVASPCKHKNKLEKWSPGRDNRCVRALRPAIPGGKPLAHPSPVSTFCHGDSLQLPLETHFLSACLPPQCTWKTGSWHACKSSVCCGRYGL